MKSIILYTTGCPKCRVLESKLKSKGIDFDTVTDVEKMISMGIMEAPVLEVGGVSMSFNQALEWVLSQK